MSGKRRIAPVLVDDPDVEWIHYQETGQHIGPLQAQRTHSVPVPPDDQLTRALDRQTRSAILYHRPSAEIAGHPGSVEALRDAKLIRAAFHLDEGSDDE